MGNKVLNLIEKGEIDPTQEVAENKIKILNILFDFFLIYTDIWYKNRID